MALTSQAPAPQEEKKQESTESKPAQEPAKVDQPPQQPQQKKKMTAVEIEAKLNEFNKELDLLTQKLGINIPLNGEFD